MSDEQPFPTFNLWHRIRFAYWVITTPKMTELRISRAIIAYAERNGINE